MCTSAFFSAFLIILIVSFQLKNIEGYDEEKCKQYESDSNCKMHCEPLDKIKPFLDTSTDNNIKTFMSKITNYTHETLKTNADCNNCMYCLIEKTSENLKNS